MENQEQVEYYKVKAEALQEKVAALERIVAELQTKVSLLSIKPDRPTHTPHDWPEDFYLENGNYQNKCIKCGTLFHGYKRRSQCQLCSPSLLVAVNTVFRIRLYQHPENKSYDASIDEAGTITRVHNG
jgi:hypothetical protein